MAVVLFYEKPGCGTNARQKRMLEMAGHDIIVRNLLTQAWSASRLRSFFGDTPVASWFNPAAPRVKSGDIDPDRIGPEAALTLMLAEPLLIRRPLVEAAGQRCAGFDREPVPTLLGKTRAASHVQACTRQKDAPPCPDPDRPDPDRPGLDRAQA